MWIHPARLLTNPLNSDAKIVNSPNKQNFFSLNLPSSNTPILP